MRIDVNILDYILARSGEKHFGRISGNDEG